MLRFGRVASVNADKHTVRVTFSDVDKDAKDLESYDLPVLVGRPGDYWLPTADTYVACQMDPGPWGAGVVMGVFYNGESAPPLSDAGQRSIASDDLRLGTPDASDPVALAPAVKAELDKIRDAFNNHFHAAGTLLAPNGPVTGITAAVAATYTPEEVGAENVSAS